jgi:hypothetical protein
MLANLCLLVCSSPQGIHLWYDALAKAHSSGEHSHEEEGHGHEHKTGGDGGQHHDHASHSHGNSWQLGTALALGFVGFLTLFSVSK